MYARACVCVCVCNKYLYLSTCLPEVLSGYTSRVFPDGTCITSYSHSIIRFTEEMCVIIRCVSLLFGYTDSGLSNVFFLASHTFILFHNDNIREYVVV